MVLAADGPVQVLDLRSRETLVVFVLFRRVHILVLGQSHVHVIIFTAHRVFAVFFNFLDKVLLKLVFFQ